MLKYIKDKWRGKAMCFKRKKKQKTSENKGIKQSETYKKSNTKRKIENFCYRVVYDSERRMWAIKKDGAKRVIKRLPTKAEALSLAKELSETQNFNLTVHKKDGKFQKQA